MLAIPDLERAAFVCTFSITGDRVSILFLANLLPPI